MREVLTLTLPLFGLIFFGFVAGRIANRPASGLEWLNIFLLYLALPALFFQLLSQTPFEELSNVGFIVAIVISTFSIFAIAFAIGLVRSRFDIERATIQALVSSYSNHGYLGLGLAISALGAPAAVPIALIFTFENIGFFTLTPVLMSLGGAQRSSAWKTALRIVRRIFTHPFILAVIAGMLAAAFEWRPPEMIDRLLTMLRGAAAPCALFAMGVTVALQPPPTRRSVGDLSIFLTIKLIGHPVMAYLVVSTVSVDPLWLTAAVLMAALPPATNVFILATQYWRFVEGASNAILVGTAISAFTVPLILYAIRAGLL